MDWKGETRADLRTKRRDERGRGVVTLCELHSLYDEWEGEDHIPVHLVGSFP